MVRLSIGESGLDKESAVNLAQILTIDKTRLVNKLGCLSDERMDEVDKAIKLSLDL
jgi:mRNA interferase MazF